MLVNVVKCQDYSFYPVIIIKGKPAVGGWGEGATKHLNIRVNMPIQKSDKNNGTGSSSSKWLRSIIKTLILQISITLLESSLNYRYHLSTIWRGSHWFPSGPWVS